MSLQTAGQAVGPTIVRVGADGCEVLRTARASVCAGWPIAEVLVREDHLFVCQSCGASAVGDPHAIRHSL
jgi:hypothetical protein